MPSDINPDGFVQCISPIKANKIYTALQTDWQVLLEHITEEDAESPGEFSVEDCRNINHTGKERARYTINWFGNRGLKVRRLIEILDIMGLEHALIGLKDPEPLKIVEQPESFLNLFEGDTIRLVCTAKGFPYPRYTWFKGQKQVFSGLDGVLEIRDARVDHEGHYICRIHNVKEKGVLWSGHWCHVTIKTDDQRKLAHDDCRPVITVHPVEELDVKHGEAIELNCSSLSSDVTYQWTFNNVDIPEEIKPNLKITAALYKHEGEYQCRVRNAYGTSESTTTRVSVRAPNQKRDVIILEHPTDEQCVIGRQIEFRVKVADRLNVQYIWYHNSQPINGAKGSTLIVDVETFQQGGRYQCRVTVYNKKHEQINEEMSRESQLEVKRAIEVKTAEDKVALILANSAFKCVEHKNLPGVHNDIIVTTKQLEGLGFKVYSYLNLTLEEMWVALHMFRGQLRDGVYALIYLAGHGFFHNNQEYLMPSDAALESDADENLCVHEAINFLQKEHHKPTIMLVVMEICLTEFFKIKAVSGRREKTLKPFPNFCIIRSNGPEEKAYEETPASERHPRGLFNQYFLRAIQRELFVSDMIKHLKYDFDQHPYDKKDYPMCVNHQSFLSEEDRSLHDPIHIINKSEADNREKRYTFMHDLPPTFVKHLGKHLELRLTFVRLTTNILEMQCDFFPACRIPMKVDNVPEGVECLKVDQQAKFRFYNLQRLKDFLQITLSVAIANPAVHPDHWHPIDVNLGAPLIAVMQESWQKILFSFSKKGDIDAAATFIRQATEQSESDSLTGESDA